MLIINWIFGIGIIQCPIGKEHRILGFVYTLVHLFIFCSLTYFSHLHYFDLKIVKLMPLFIKLFGFIIDFSETILILITSWFQSKVKYKLFYK